MPRPWKFRDFNIVAEPINYGGIYSVIMAGYYSSMVSQLSKEDVVLDGGANVGAFSILVSKIVKKVVSVEANPKNYQYLVENINNNNITNIIPINAALTDYKGYVRLEGQGEGGHISSDGVLIQSTTIDDIELDLGVNFTSLKLDIEGASLWQLCMAQLSQLTMFQS